MARQLRLLTRTGTFTTPQDGTIMGWFDGNGMDQLRVSSMNGHSNGLWFESLEMQTTTSPEPGVLALIGCRDSRVASKKAHIVGIFISASYTVHNAGSMTSGL